MIKTNRRETTNQVIALLVVASIGFVGAATLGWMFTTAYFSEGKNSSASNLFGNSMFRNTDSVFMTFTYSWAVLLIICLLNQKSIVQLVNFRRLLSAITFFLPVIFTIAASVSRKAFESGYFSLLTSSSEITQHLNIGESVIFGIYKLIKTSSGIGVFKLTDSRGTLDIIYSNIIDYDKFESIVNYHLLIPLLIAAFCIADIVKKSVSKSS